MNTFLKKNFLNPSLTEGLKKSNHDSESNLISEFNMNKLTSIELKKLFF